MCDRYSITASLALINQVFKIQMENTFDPRYNAGPSQKLPVIKANAPKSVEMVNWGLISNWANNKKISPKLFNLSIDSVLSKNIYQKGLKENRCIILADGFYCWKQTGKKQIIPYYFYLPDQQPFGIAGLWEDYEDFEGKSAHSFIMLTKTANKQMAAYQEDMPLLLQGAQLNQWLDRYVDVETLQAGISQELTTPLKSHAVSPLIGDLKNNSPALIKPTSPSDQHGNYTLFS